MSTASVVAANQTVDPQNERVKHVVEAMGLDAANLKVVDDNWALRLLDGGVWVDLSIGRPLGKKKLTFEDLGIKPSSDPEQAKLEKEAFNLGERYIFPRKLIGDIATRETLIRRNLTDNTVQNRRFGNFMTGKTWQVFKTKHDEETAKLFGIRDFMVENYDLIKQEAVDMFRQVAPEIWRRLRRQGADKNPPAAWVEEYVARAMRGYPTPEEIYESFYVEMTPVIIPMFSLLGQGGGVDMDSQLRQDIAREWRGKVSGVIDGFLSDAVKTLRGRVFNAVSNAKEVMTRNGKVKTKTIQSLRALVETVKAIDPYGDTELETALAALSAQMTGGENDVNQETLMTTIDDLSTLLGASLSLMGFERGGERSELGTMGDLPDPEQIRGARERLGLGGVETPDVVQSVIRNNLAFERDL